MRYKHFWKQRDESARQVPFGPEHYTEAGVLVTPDRGMHESAALLLVNKYNRQDWRTKYWLEEGEL